MNGNNTPVAAGVGLKAAVESRGGQAIYEAQSILKELRLQSDIYGEADIEKRKALGKAFAGRMLLSAELVVFVGMIGGMLRPVHTVQVFGGDVYDPSPFDEKCIAFVGDRTAARMPRSYVFEESHLLWSTVSDVVASEAALRVFLSGYGKQKEILRGRRSGRKN